jgi:methyltransferase (TIGR00027 family)
MTSRWVAAARARESGRPDRLFDDPLAGALAGEEGRRMLEELAAGASAPGAAPTQDASVYLAIRTRFFDDWLLAAAASGITQIVILAAGMDTRAFRLAWPPGTRVFEVERPDVLDYKEEVLRGLGPTPSAERILVARDLRQDFGAALERAGFSRARPAAFLVEGLLPYLPGEGDAAGLLAAIAALAAPASLIGLDLVGQSFLASQWTQRHLAQLAARGVPWLFGSDDPEGLLGRAGFRDVEKKEPPEVAHGRWPYPIAPSWMQGVPRTYLVVARR